jgi:four helix bundle protein
MDFAEILRRRTMAFTLAVIRFCRTLPHTCEVKIVRDQLIRSGSSVGANYRSSCRGRSPEEKRAKLGIALEEADESDFWLSILEALKEGDNSQRQWLLRECGELIKIFSTSLATHRRRSLPRQKSRRTSSQTGPTPG